MTIKNANLNEIKYGDKLKCLGRTNNDRLPIWWTKGKEYQVVFEYDSDTNLMIYSDDNDEYTLEYLESSNLRFKLVSATEERSLDDLDLAELEKYVQLRNAEIYLLNVRAEKRNELETIENNLNQNEKDLQQLLEVK